MTNLNLYNKYSTPNANQDYNPAFAQGSAGYSPNMQGLPPSMQGLDYDSLKLQAEAKSKDNAVAQAVKDYDIMEHPWVLAKNLILSLGMGVSITTLTNWLMSSKQIANGATNLQDFQNTRLYRAGQVLDDKVGNSAVGKFFGGVKSKIGGFFSKIPVPNFIREIRQRIGIGSIAVLDKQGMYSLGKGAEALNEFVEYLSRVPENELKALGLNGINASKTAEKEVLEILKLFKEGKMRGPIAYQKIAKYFDKVPAKSLSALTVGASSKLDTILKTKPDINLSLNKARFFNGAYNTAQKPLAKGMQKITSLFGEAAGNGVLGGKMALFMGSLGLVTGFNAASSAEKGDKLKAFMEDFIGFTLGSYLMSFVVGTWFNKFLGVSELGLDKAKVEAVGKKLGVDMSAGRLQDVVIAYNREYKRTRALSSLAEDLRNGKISVEKAASKMAGKYNIEAAKGCTKAADLLAEINKVIGTKDAKYFDAIRKDIKDALKSKLTIGSIFKETKENSGNFLSRMGRYLVQKPLALAGRILSVGRYDLVHGEKYSLRSFLKWGKRFGGGLGRALLVMFVLVEPFRKGFMKLSHAIFGKPKNSFLDQEKAEKEKREAEKHPEVAPVPAQSPSGAVVNKQVSQNTNILNNMLNKPQSASPVMAASKLSEKDTPKKWNDAKIAALEMAPELKRSYIPSSKPSKFALQKDPQEAEAEAVLLKAQKAERAAQEFLSNGI